MPRKISLKTSFLLSFFSAILLILSFPVPDIGFFAWFGLLPLLFAIDRKRPKEAFLLSYFTGILFFSAILYWLIHVSLPGLIILVLYLGLYFGLFGLLVSIGINRFSSSPRASLLPARGGPSESKHLTRKTLPANIIRFRFLLFIPSLWVSLEFLRSYLFTGFGWTLLGYSQYRNLPLIQISDISGAYGVSFLIVVVNVAIWETVRQLRFHYLSKSPRAKLKVGREVVILVLSLLFVFSYGFFQLHRGEEGEEIKISLIQGNIPQNIKWDEDAYDFVIDRYELLTRRAAFNLPQLIIWPETVVPVYSYPRSVVWNKVFRLVRDMKIPFLIGLPRDTGDKQFNSAALISEKGEITAYYDKIHLVPFGEYTPGGDLFSSIKMINPRAGGGNFSRGTNYTIFEVPLYASPAKFGVLICYEDIFPNLARRFVLRGADFLVNITNDAWFGDTSAPYQHAQASVFRAVENRISVVRSANTGPSMFIDSRGRIIASLVSAEGEDLFITGHKTAKIRLSKGALSFYTRFGDIFAFLSVIISIHFFCNLRLRSF